MRVFISYSWDSDEHIAWTKRLCDDLISAGIDAVIDQYDLELGDPIPAFMESSIRDCDKVLIVMTPKYKERADQRLGGAGYEQQIITAEVNALSNQRKFIPVLVAGTWSTSTPTWATGKLGVDMTTKQSYKTGLQRLIDTINGKKSKPKPGAKRETLTKDEYNDRGIKKHKAGDYTGAISDYTKAIELDPNYVYAYYNRGNAYDDLKQYNKAISYYTKAIELDPIDAYAYYNRGNAHNKLEQYNKAIADYSKAIELAPNYAETYNNRGISYCDLQQYSKAIEDFTKAIELNPNYANAYNNRGYAYRNLQKHDNAIADFTKAIELDPNNPDYYHNRANTYDRMGKIFKATADRIKAKELESNQ